LLVVKKGIGQETAEKDQEEEDPEVALFAVNSATLHANVGTLEEAVPATAIAIIRIVAAVVGTGPGPVLVLGTVEDAVAQNRSPVPDQGEENIASPDPSPARERSPALGRAAVIARVPSQVPKEPAVPEAEAVLQPRTSAHPLRKRKVVHIAAAPAVVALRERAAGAIVPTRAALNPKRMEAGRVPPLPLTGSRLQPIEGYNIRTPYMQ